MEEKNILLLRICKEGFEKTINKGIPFKFREAKNYWEQRLLNSDGSPKDFDEVHIKNGYKANSPLAIVEWKGHHGICEHKGKDCFKFELGKVLRIENYIPEE